MSAPRRWPAPWLFSLLILPLGINVGFKATPLPFLLAKAGVPVDHIARISSIVNLPGTFIFLSSPLADIKLRRRTWLSVGAFGCALFACIYVPLIGPKHVTLMTMLILTAGVAESLIMAGCGGLMVKALSLAAQAEASAWWQAGFLGGGAFGGAAILWLATRLPILFVGLCTAALIALPGLLPFSISEPAPGPSPSLRELFKGIGKEIWDVIRTPERRWSAALLVAPGGTGAAMFLLPGRRFSLRCGSNRRHVDQRRRRRRADGLRLALRHSDSFRLGSTFDVRVCRSVERVRCSGLNRCKSSFDLSGGHSALSNHQRIRLGVVHGIDGRGRWP